MNLPDIANLEDLLSGLLDNNKNHVNIERKRFNTPGENYGSLIIAIKITIQEEDGKETEHNLVAKVAPPNEFLKRFMNISYTFRNEYGFYNTILPCLRHFQQEQGSSKTLDFFPKFLGGRLSMDPAKEHADDDVVILLTNLKEEGFVMADRDLGFDLSTSKLVLERLAELHSVALAVKTLRPDLFKENMMPFFEEYQMFNIDEQLVTSEKMTNVTLNLVEDDELCSLYIERIKDTISDCNERLKLARNSAVFREGVFTTLIHGDMWINNILVKLYNNKIVDVKFVDLQLYEYHSITKDVLFFIFTSIQVGVLQTHVNSLIDFYFTTLIANLRELQCDTQQFSFEEFMEEMKQTAKKQMYLHVMAVLHLIHATKEKVWDVDVIDKDKFKEQITISEEAKKRGVLITREFIRRGWI